MNIIIGDEHGRGKFQRIYEKIKEQENIKTIVCLGDYFDPYEDFFVEDMIENFNYIINCARYDSRVKLILGNHDVHYLISTDTSRYNRHAAVQFRELFTKNWDLFNLCIEDGSTIISHAGISPTWMKLFDLKTANDINNILKSNEDMQRMLVYDYDDYSGWGDSAEQSPVWIRPYSLMDACDDWKWDKQIVGHTRTDVDYIAKGFKGEFGKVIEYTKNNKTLVLADTGDNDDYYSYED